MLAVILTDRLSGSKWTVGLWLSSWVVGLFCDLTRLSDLLMQGSRERYYIGTRGGIRFLPRRDLERRDPASPMEGFSSPTLPARSSEPFSHPAGSRARNLLTWGCPPPPTPPPLGLQNEECLEDLQPRPPPRSLIWGCPPPPWASRMRNVSRICSPGHPPDL